MYYRNLINDGQFTNSLLSSLLPPNYILSQNYGRPHTFRGGGDGVAIIITRNLFIILLYPLLFSPHSKALVP